MRSTKLTFALALIAFVGLASTAPVGAAGGTGQAMDKICDRKDGECGYMASCLIMNALGHEMCGELKPPFGPPKKAGGGGGGGLKFILWDICERVACYVR